jgi:hypothetical protein
MPTGLDAHVDAAGVAETDGVAQDPAIASLEAKTKAIMEAWDERLATPEKRRRESEELISAQRRTQQLKESRT